jgi:hypothetical protein
MCNKMAIVNKNNHANTNSSKCLYKIMFWLAEITKPNVQQNKNKTPECKKSDKLYVKVMLTRISELK